MKYISEQGDASSVWYRARKEIGCSCPKETPICVEIPWDHDEHRLKTYCVGCKKRGFVIGKLHIPSYYPDPYPSWANRMCVHALRKEAIEVSAPSHTIREQVIFGAPALRFFYCSKCRRVFRMVLSESTAPYSL